MLSTSCKYALRAAVYLSANTDDLKKAGIKEISEEIQANEHTTAKILQLLAREKIIASTKGPNGGFYISRHAKKIKMIDIVRVVDSTTFFSECGLGLLKCSEKRPCPIHETFKVSRERLLKDFSTITIQDLANDLEKGETFLRR